MSWTNFKKYFLIFFVLLLLTSIGIAQSANPVTITVSNTGYDNPNLTGLKEYLKADSKVKGLKSTFNNSVATLNFTYSDAADELWDEIPADKKQGFKLTSIDSKIIKLQVVKTAPTTDIKTDSKNCGCDYFPLCKFDKTRSFMGEVWKGFDNNGKVTYYHCANGILKAKYELFDNFEGNSLGFATYTALKQNEPKGGSWKETIDINGAKYFYEHIIIQKNIRIKVDDKEYSDAIKVRRIVNAASLFYQGQPQNLMQIEYGHIYYVKNIGSFAEKEVKEIPQSETERKSQVESDKKIPLYQELTNGVWVFEKIFKDTHPDSKGKWIEAIDTVKNTITFNTDGIVNHQVKNSAYKDATVWKEYWRISNNTIETKGLDNTNWGLKYDVLSENGAIYLKDIITKELFKKIKPSL